MLITWKLLMNASLSWTIKDVLVSQQLDGEDLKQLCQCSQRDQQMCQRFLQMKMIVKSKRQTLRLLLKKWMKREK